MIESKQMSKSDSKKNSRENENPAPAPSSFPGNPVKNSGCSLKSTPRNCQMNRLDYHLSGRDFDF